MSNVVINQTRLHLGLTSGGKVDFVASDSYSIERTRSAAAVPQRRDTVQQHGNFRTKGYSMSAMSDERHDPVLRAFPRRFFHTSVRKTGQILAGESVVSALALNLGFDSPVTWSLTTMVDGEEQAAPAPTEFEGIQEAYHESQCDYLFGGAAFLANLTSAAQGGTLTGAYTVAATSRRTGTGVRGMSHDVTQFGLSASLTLLLDAESDKLLDQEEGIMVIRRRDASFAYFVPMIVTAFPVAAPIGGAATISAGFTQAPGPVVMSAPSSTSAATFTGTQGGTTYNVGADKITAS